MYECYKERQSAKDSANEKRDEETSESVRGRKRLQAEINKGMANAWEKRHINIINI